MAPAHAVRILLVDDDPVARGSMREILVRRGYECTEAASAEEAVRLTTLQDCHLIVSDICMPGNNELEMLERLAALPSPVPVILLTGHPSLETAIRAVQLRVVGYLTKPVDPSTLLNLVARACESLRTTRLIGQHRGRLESQLAEMQQLERAAITDDALGSYASLCMRQMLISLTDIYGLIEALAARDSDETAQRRLGSARPFLLLDAIRETIHVLEKTKTSFKSRELAELRAKLESLIAGDKPRPSTLPS